MSVIYQNLLLTIFVCVIIYLFPYLFSKPHKARDICFVSVLIIPICWHQAEYLPHSRQLNICGIFIGIEQAL